MIEHPTPDELEAFLRGDLPPLRLREIVRHLLVDCDPCRSALAACREPSTSDATTYDEALDRAFRKARSYARHFQHQISRAQKASTLLSQGGGLHSLCTEGDLPLRGLGIYQALLERSWSIRHHDLKEMVDLAQAAVEVARKLNPQLYGQKLLADFQARAWAELGNAYRAADDLDKADKAFGVAFELLLEGTGDLQLKARLYDLYASFLGTYRRFDLAFASINIVHDIYLELGNRHLAGRALVTKAIYTLYKGHAEDALKLNQDAKAFIDKESDPELFLQAIHNHLACLVACGRFKEANKALFENRTELTKLKGRSNTRKMRWLEAQINAGLGRWNSAEIAMLDVKHEFEEEEMAYHAALVSLELGLLWMRQDRLREAKGIVREAVEVFLSLGIHREALGAVQILNDARQRGKMTVGLLASVVEYLHRAQHNPDIPFVPKWA